MVEEGETFFFSVFDAVSLTMRHHSQTYNR